MPDDPADPMFQRMLLDQRGAVLSYVQRRLPPSLRGAVDPADVAQDVCCEALRRAGSFRPELDPTGQKWLFTIARRRITRLMERARVARQRTESGLPVTARRDPVVGLLEQLAVYERTPSRSAAAHETMAEVQRSLGRLRPAHAAVIRSRFVDRLSSVEMAAQMGRTPAAIDKLFARAMDALRAEME